MKSVSNATVCEHDKDIKSFEQPSRYKNNSKCVHTQPDIIPSEINKTKHICSMLFETK